MLILDSGNEGMLDGRRWMGVTHRINNIVPSGVICFQGLAGYMKLALLIWSHISSSSLNGNVPLRVT